MPTSKQIDELIAAFKQTAASVNQIQSDIRDTAGIVQSVADVSYKQGVADGATWTALALVLLYLLLGKR